MSDLLLKQRNIVLLLNIINELLQIIRIVLQFIRPLHLYHHHVLLLSLIRKQSSQMHQLLLLVEGVNELISFLFFTLLFFFKL